MDFSLALGSPPPLSALIAAGPVALFLDFDGTLVELASGPNAIEPIGDLSKRLDALALRLGGRLAIVSGRGIADIESHIGDVAVAIAGSHGSDIRSAGGVALGAGPAVLPKAIEQALRDFAFSEGVNYEHKPHGGALHYRANPDCGPAVHAFAQNLADEHGWAVQNGKCVAELVAKNVSKGSAVTALMNTPPFAGSRPIFIGDDVTDEAGFRACHDLDGVGILVGNIGERRDKTDAAHHLNSVAAVHAWLEL